MAIVKFGRNEIVLLDSPDELTLDRFAEYNRLILMDSGIGTDFNGIVSHVNKLIEFHKAKDGNALITESRNMITGIYQIVNGMNLKHYTFAIMIKSINGDPVTDFTESGLKKTLEKITELGLTKGDLSKGLEEVKKNGNLN